MRRVLVQLARTTEQYKTTHYVILGWQPGAWEFATWALGTSQFVLGQGVASCPPVLGTYDLGAYDRDGYCLCRRVQGLVTCMPVLGPAVWELATW